MEMHQRLSNLIWLLVLPICLGCQQTKVILVPNGDPVLLAEPVKAKVYAFDAQGNMTGYPTKVTIPAGWYALPKLRP
jgi:H+/gluconate symporter-like permease